MIQGLTASSAPFQGTHSTEDGGEHVEELGGDGALAPKNRCSGRHHRLWCRGQGPYREREGGGETERAV